MDRIRLGLLTALLVCQSSLVWGQATITYFYLVNRTGRAVTVGVYVDGRELFVKQLNAQVTPSPGKEHPQPPPYPAVEFKIPVNKHAKRLEVQESLGRQKFFHIRGFTNVGAGFRIVIWEDSISLTQDYYPAR